MESLCDVNWDVVISGTGVPQSLLALALSRSGKAILHLDKNDFYGGDDAAFGLQEAEQWVKNVSNESDSSCVITKARITTIPLPVASDASSKLGSSRSYTLTLSPQFIYSQSTLLLALVSTRINSQLEFQAVGSWWACKESSMLTSSFEAAETAAMMPSGVSQRCSLQRIPGNREDLFADETLSTRDRLSLVKFLRHVMRDVPSESDSVDTTGDESLASTLATTFKLPPYLHQPLLALSLSHVSTASTKARHAITRIRRHLRSIGVFGPGFGAVLPKYGGGAEIAQVGCRAGAVGGAIYVLGRGISEIIRSTRGEDHGIKEQESKLLHLRLSDGEEIKTRFLVGAVGSVPEHATDRSVFESTDGLVQSTHSISIVSSALPHIFPPLYEGGPIPAGVVVVFNDEHSSMTKVDSSNQLPIYLVVHSAETGECPNGQSVIYGSIARADETAETQLSSAVRKLLQTAEATATSATILWSMSYVLNSLPTSCDLKAPFAQDESGQVMTFPPPRLDLAFDDAVLDSVKAVWKRIMGAEADEGDFMRFEDRGGGDEFDD